MLAVMVGAGLALSASTALTQNATTVAQPAATSATVPQLSYGVAEIVKLVQAKVSDDTIIAYIKNTGNSYGLNAAQIIYLRQQGVSEAVITTILNQPKSATATATIPLPTTPAPQPVASTADTGQAPTATVAPTVTYVQTVPDTTYYYYQPYYYPAYVWYPPVTFSFGWGWGGWHGGGWHGGGFHRGGHR